MKAYDWNQLPPTEQDGRIRRVVAGDRITVLRQTIRKGMPLSGAHAHPQEQISIILEGRARFTCNGESAEFGPGGVVVFPGGSLHSTENTGGGDLIVEEIFSPAQETLNQLAPK
ncbi:MAG: cupin domain-containing protein [Candidatus Tectomicrobia bacterium]|nr:cupin domain-containing protein [Candidatus Tectomicrobia bacterium]MBI2177566.1 cupin domain-containing protein [Candidatus Tectomicrobia bacterium]